ncbi:MAG: polyprenol monophosphomannose synthase [Candidatus Omnitrophica bacterium]|nr:polyprenol monophosphomannose synthase [Candidatus Omnitrophota bacterium]
MKNRAVVVIPTYNEKDNILRLVDEISGIVPGADILVVDDNSPDGTGDIAESASKTRPNLSVLHRCRKDGLGPAYIEAFRHLLKKNKYGYVVQMDADFSHSPKDIPRLIDAAADCDVAVGSRYTKGGAVTGKWHVARKCISQFGNVYARLVTGLGIGDCTAGFKCYNARVLEKIDFNRIFLNGYGFQIQMLYESKRNDFRICEIPIFFNERAKGKSKMDITIVWEAFISLLLMRARDLFSKK